MVGTSGHHKLLIEDEDKANYVIVECFISVAAQRFNEIKQIMEERR